MKTCGLLLFLCLYTAPAQAGEAYLVRSVSVKHMFPGWGHLDGNGQLRFTSYNEDNRGPGLEMCEDKKCMVVGTYTDSFKSQEAYFGARFNFDSFFIFDYGLTTGVITHSIAKHGWAPICLPTISGEAKGVGFNLYITPVAAMLQLKLRL